MLFEKLARVFRTQAGWTRLNSFSFTSSNSPPPTEPKSPDKEKIIVDLPLAPPPQVEEVEEEDNKDKVWDEILMMEEQLNQVRVEGILCVCFRV